MFEGTSEYCPADAGQDLRGFGKAQSFNEAPTRDQGAEDAAHRRPDHRKDKGKKARLFKNRKKVMRAIEAIGLIIMIGIVLGVILTSVWIVIIAIRSDPDFEDQDDREIYENKYWEKRNNNKKA